MPTVTAELFHVCDDKESRKTQINLLTLFVYPSRAADLSDA